MAFKYKIGFTGACVLMHDTVAGALVVLMINAPSATDVAFKDMGGTLKHVVPAHVPALVYRQQDRGTAPAGEVRFTGEDGKTPMAYVPIAGEVSLSPSPVTPALDGKALKNALANLGRAGAHAMDASMTLAKAILPSGSNLGPFVARATFTAGELQMGRNVADSSGDILWQFKDPVAKPNSGLAMPLPEEAVLTFELPGQELTVTAGSVGVTFKHPGTGSLRIDLKNLPKVGITGPWSNKVQSPIWHWDLFYKAFDNVALRPLPYDTCPAPGGPNEAAPRCPPSQFP